MPKVSVVITAYNAMAYLPETVESVLKQTFTDFELVIINNGSTDHIAEWVSQIVDPRVSLISQNNKGIPGGLNTGISHAQGEYIAFIDADDLWEPTKLEKQVRCLENNPAVGLVYTWMLLIDEEGRSTGRFVTSHAEGDVWKSLTKSCIVGSGSAAMVRRCCFEAVGFFDQSLGFAADWDMWFRIASHYQFAVLKEALVQYRKHPGSSISQNWQAMLNDFGVIIEREFNSAPAEMLYLKRQSYGRLKLHLAWNCLKSIDKNYKGAIQLRQQALADYPQLLFSWEFIRLSITIKLMQWLGTQKYDKTLHLFYTLRCQVLEWKNSLRLQRFQPF